MEKDFLAWIDLGLRLEFPFLGIFDEIYRAGEGRLLGTFCK
jgi:hypothetical protein